MKTYYDTVADVFFVVFGDSIPQRFEHIGPVSVAFDDDDKVCEIEVASAWKNLGLSKIFDKDSQAPVEYKSYKLELSKFKNTPCAYCCIPITSENFSARTHLFGKTHQDAICRQCDPLDRRACPDYDSYVMENFCEKHCGSFNSMEHESW